jgi:hypothetical protein
LVRTANTGGGRRERTYGGFRKENGSPIILLSRKQLIKSTSLSKLLFVGGFDYF